MNEEYKDFQWKMKAVELATMEFLELEGEVKELSRMFDRARQIYNAGIEDNIFGWVSVWDEEKKPIVKKEPELIVKKKPAVKKKVKVSKDGKTKTCPKCGDEIPVLFKDHIVGSKGDCGHKF